MITPGLEHSGVQDEDLRWLEQAFHDTFGASAEAAVLLKGDASDRKLLRIRGGGNSAIGVMGPSLEENRAFIAFARGFRASRLPVPEIHAVDPRERCYLEEDLGETTLAAWLDSHREGDGIDAAAEQMYRDVLDDLLRFQIDAADAVDYSYCYQTAEFGTDAMRFDLAYFRSMFLEPLVRIPYDSSAYVRDGERLISLLLESERRFFLYRDFQSRNIMVRDGAPWFIDFQSGRRGALQYDVAALLFDSKGRLPRDIRQRLLEHYMDGVQRRISIERRSFARLFEGFAVLRLLQALGAFGNLGLNKNKPSFLTLIPSRLQSLAMLVREAEIMENLPNLQKLLLDISGQPDALHLEFPES
ncbi:phosphotransferase [bacterium]|nr:phosphotransferase [bacterium]